MIKNNECLDYWGYMHGKSKTEYEEEPFLTLNEVFNLKSGTILRGSVGTYNNLKIKIYNGYELLVINSDGTTEFLTKRFTLRAITKMKFYKED